jgi:DNA invertase Pin-like site-specific DNA recombinase
MKPEPQRRAAGYIRVSTVSQAREGESLGTQREGITLYCKAHGLGLIEIYADEGISGASTEKRPGFMQLLQDAKDRKFDCLIIHSLSRFGRNTKETISNYDELESHGVKLVFLKESVDTGTPSGRMFRNLLAVFAEWERDTIRERMSENRTVRWKDGRTFVGKVPFGYVWNREKKAIEIIQEEARIYKHIVDLYLHEGLSDLNTALRLKDDGIKLRGRKFPATQTISYILKNPAYYGHYIVNRHEYEGDRRTGKMKPASQYIHFPIPALISKTKWDEIQKKREFNRAKAKRVSISKDFWLRDLLICNACGGKIIAYPHSRPRKDGSLPRYYGCYAHKTTSKRLEATGRRRCKLPLINAEQVENQVWYDLMETLTFGGFDPFGGGYEPSKMEILVDTAHYDDQILTLETVYGRNEEELRRKELAKSRIFDLLETDDFDRDEFHYQLIRTDDEILRLKSLLADIQGKIENLREAKANNEAFIEFIRGNQEWLSGIRQELHDLSPEDKKRLVESLVDGKIDVFRVWPCEDEGETGPGWAQNWRFSFNRAILDNLAAEGKLSYLTKNDRSRSGSPGPAAFRPPAGRWPPPGSPGPRRTAPPPGAARGGARRPLAKNPDRSRWRGASRSSRPR